MSTSSIYSQKEKGSTRLGETSEQRAKEHLRRLIRDFICDLRVQDSQFSGPRIGWPLEPKPAADTSLISLPRLGGLHHRYAALSGI